MLAPARLGPGERAAAWAGLSDAEYDVVVVGGGVTGAGVALDAATRGLRGAARRAAGLRLRHLLAQLQAVPRRPALPGAARTSRWCARRCGSASSCSPVSRRTWSSRSRSSTRCGTGCWERPYVTAGLVLYDPMGGARSVPGHRHLTPAQGARDGARRCGKDALTGALLLLRRAGRRRPAHDDAWRAPAATYGATVLQLRPRSPASQHAGERVVGVRRARRRDRRGGRRCRRGWSSTAPGCGPTTSRRLAGGRGRFHVRASKGVHLVVPRDRINSGTGLILRTETSRSCS